jgi:16S rRNA (guanine527-N7)-methyltransferase
MSTGIDGRGSGDTGAAPDPSPPEVPPPPAEAQRIFGDRLDVAEHFAALLSDTGVSHGLVGPREVPILWERHILNCAVVHPAFPEGAELVDVGSGAGLPGVAMAVARPDLHVHLIEPMLRRTTWLDAAIEELGLTNCTVHRGRAEEFHGRLALPFATARAVARVDKLARWTFPLLRDGGTLVALKGSRVEEELTAQERALRRLGMTSSAIRSYGAEVLEVPTVTLELTVGPMRTRAARVVRGGRRTKPKRAPNRR